MSSESPIALSNTSRSGSREEPPSSTPLPWLARLACGWALLYAAYRGYYALGGTFGMFGTPVSDAKWRFINGVAAILLILAAALAAISPRLFQLPRARTVLIGVGWIITVGCVMHALVDEATRFLSLAGVLHLELPFFTTIDRRAADLQDIFLNEPWFFVEGVLWGALCWRELKSATHRRSFLLSALVAIVVLTVIGILSAIGVIGRFIIG
jgi:hypothetical protein